MNYLTDAEIAIYCSASGITSKDIRDASATIDSYAQRSYGVLTYTEQVSLTKRRGFAKGKLRHYPRVTIEEVTARVLKPTGVTLVSYDPSSIYFDDEEFEYFTFVPQEPAITPAFAMTAPYELWHSPHPTSIIVKYTSGYEVIPEELKIATGMVADAIATNGGITTWKSKTNFDMTVVLSDKDDPIMSAGIRKILDRLRLK